MLFEEWETSKKEFIKSLFDERSLLAFSWTDVIEKRGELACEFKEWLDVQGNPGPNPLLLPITYSGDCFPHWYAISFDQRQCEELREQLHAFVGQVECDFNKLKFQSDSPNSLETKIFDYSNNAGVFKFRSLEFESHKSLRSRIERMLRVRKMRPKESEISLQTLESILRDFNGALGKDQKIAIKKLNELKNHGRITGGNIQFLEISYLASFEKWFEILNIENFDGILELKKPARVTREIIESLWHVEFESFSKNMDVDGAVNRMKELSKYERLFSSVENFHQAPVLAMFMLFALSTEPQRTYNFDKLISRVSKEDSLRSFIDTIASKVTDTNIDNQEDPDESQLELVRKYMAKNLYDLAWDTLISVDFSTQRTELLFDCAQEFDSVDGKIIVLRESMDQLETDVKEQLLNKPSRKKLWNKIRKADGDYLGPQNWESWIEKLIESKSDFSQLIEYAKKSENWVLNDKSDYNTVRCKQITELLDKAYRQEEYNIKISLYQVAPYIEYYLTLKELKGVDPKIFLPIYQKLLEIVYLNPDNLFGESDWLITGSLANKIIQLGGSADSCKNVVEIFTQIWDEKGDPNKLDWSLDFLDLIIPLQIIDENDKNDFFQSVVQTFYSNPRRIQDYHKEVLRLIAEDIDRSVDYEAIPFPSEENENELESDESIDFDLDGKVLSIYTLQEAAGKRAKKILEDKYRGLEVRLSHDKGGSSRLESMSKESHYFVVVTGSAKHAATGFIDNHWDKNKKGDLIYPGGKGSSSIIRSVEDKLSDDYSSRLAA